MVCVKKIRRGRLEPRCQGLLLLLNNPPRIVDLLHKQRTLATKQASIYIYKDVYPLTIGYNYISKTPRHLYENSSVVVQVVYYLLIELDLCIRDRDVLTRAGYR